MNSFKIIFFLVGLFFFCTFSEINAQKSSKNSKNVKNKKVTKTEKVAKTENKTTENEEHRVDADSSFLKELEIYKTKSTQLISYLEYSLNMLGDTKTSAKEKDIIFNTSYKKAFLNEKVQIEDDLDENRVMIINKDVQAYLKDIDFFFKSVTFKFTIQEMQHSIMGDENLFITATINRNIKGITIDGDSVNSNKVRYIEINIDRNQNDLKIASIYTNKLNEDEDLCNWWNSLSTHWKKIFAKDVVIADTFKLCNVSMGTERKLTYYKKNINAAPELLFANLRRIAKIKEIDLSKDSLLSDIEPLIKLTNLKEINLSNTGITDLVPLRNLTKLEVLKFSNTLIDDISPLKYSTNIVNLLCNNTLVDNLNVAKNFLKLEKLDCSSTQVADLSPLEQLVHLKDVRINNTKVANLSPIQKIDSIEIIDISLTKVGNLEALKGKSKLKILFCDNTPISSLNPLSGNKNLIKVYCDFTNINKEEANKFMTENPGVLIVFETKELGDWWTSVPKEWKKIFNKYVQISTTPTKEQLHQIVNIEKIDVSTDETILSLGPLSKLVNLKEINCSFTKIPNLLPIKDLIDLQILNCSHTRVDNLDYVQNLQNLEILNCENSNVVTVRPLFQLKSLKTLYLDYTPVAISDDKEELYRFIKKYPDCLVIYKTKALELWWQALNQAWKDLFLKYVNISANTGTPSKEQLHKIINLNQIDCSNNSKLNDLAPLKELKKLEILSVSGCNIVTLDALSNCLNIKGLDISKNPIEKIDPILGLSKITYLDCSNTRISSINGLEALKNLITLKCSGTKIGSLKSLEATTTLEVLECHTSNIRSLKPLFNLKLKTLKCYNTKLNIKKIDEFKTYQPGCDVEFY